MAKTQAERSKEYRDRQRGTTRAKHDIVTVTGTLNDAERDAKRDAVTEDRHENVTERSVTLRA